MWSSLPFFLLFSLSLLPSLPPTALPSKLCLNYCILLSIPFWLIALSSLLNDTQRIVWKGDQVTTDLLAKLFPSQKG